MRKGSDETVKDSDFSALNVWVAHLHIAAIVALMRTLVAAALCFSSLSVTLAGGALTGCSSTESSGSSTPAAVDVNDAEALKGATDVEGTLPVGSAVTIGYARKPEYTQVPYLAVELVAAKSTPENVPASATQEITVKGTFPGSPKVLVVDESYAVLATSSDPVVQADGSSITTVQAPRSAKSRFVLVHDALWSAPMTFEIGIGH